MKHNDATTPDNYLYPAGNLALAFARVLKRNKVPTVTPVIPSLWPLFLFKGREVIGDDTSMPSHTHKIRGPIRGVVTSAKLLSSK